jgi:hydrogenase nickel incorporation protein HypB
MPDPFAGRHSGGRLALRTIDLSEPERALSNTIAARVRARLEGAGVSALNLTGAPGSGKTMLLERTVRDLGEELAIAVVTGDIQTRYDADRIARHTDGIVQAVMTHGPGHLDARQIEAVLDALDLEHTRLLLIENVGSLTGPAHWDLGERLTVVVFSVTEGEDKPLKYPELFARARYVVLNKVDLLPHLRFDVALAMRFAHGVNPDLRFIHLSALTGEGMEEWYGLLRGLVPVVAAGSR